MPVSTAFAQWIAEGDGRLEVLQDFYRRWPFFRTALSNAAQVLEPLDHLQVELLRRYGSRDAEELVQRGILPTMTAS